MKKFNSVLFKDPTGNYYIGNKEDGKIIGFSLLNLLSEESKQAIDTIKDPFNLNDFLVVTIKQTKKETEIKPITCGTVYTDNEGTPAVLYDINRDDLINLFNTLVKPELLVDPVKKPKKVKKV